MKTVVDLTEELKKYFLEKDTAAKQAVEANIAPVEADASSASRAYVVGEQLFLNDVLYDVTSPISVGDAIVVNTNITAANKLSADIKSKIDDLYSKNQTLTNNVNVNGCKNLFLVDLEKIISTNKGGTWNGNTFTQKGATYTINDNDSVTFGGTPTDYTQIVFPQNVSKADKYMLSGLSGCTNVVFGGCSMYLNDTLVSSIVINSKQNTELDLSSYTFDRITVDVKRLANNTAMSGTAFIMLCLKSDWDLDNTWVAPSKTNQQLTKDTTGLLDNLEVNGAVNMLPNTATTQTINGVTFTVNDDGSITFSGTASSNTYFTISTFTLSAGTYKLNGANGGVQYKVDIQLITGGNLLASDYGDGATFTLASDTAITARIRVESGYAISGTFVFKPMITLASYNGDYVPYAKTNRQLTEDTTGLIDNQNVNGAVNMLNPVLESQVLYGITVTNNDDGTYTLNGSSGNSTGTIFFTVALKLKANHSYKGVAFISGGTITGSGSPTYTIDNRLGTQYYKAIKVNQTIVTSIFRVDADVTNYRCGIWIPTNATFSNVIVKPMVILASIMDYAFVPYAKSNRELTEDVAVKKLTFTDFFTLASGYSLSHQVLRKVANGYSIQATIQGSLNIGRNAVATMSTVIGTATEETIFGSGRCLDSNSTYHPVSVGMQIKANAELSVYTDTAITNGYCTFSMIIPF